jgi:predicted N-acyltransferase
LERKLRILQRIREVDQSGWDALAVPSSSPFVEWTWLDCLEEAGCVGGPRTGWLPHHLALFEGERLVAAAPAYLKGNSEGEFVFDWSWADLAHRMGIAYYPKLVIGVPFTPATGDRLLVAPGQDRAEIAELFVAVAQELARELPMSSAHVLFPREAEARDWWGATMMRRAGVQYTWHNHGFATWDDFLGSFNAKRRHQIKREAAQPDKDGITIRTVPGGEITPALADEMHDLYTTTVDKFHWGRRYLNRRFFRLIGDRWKDRLAWVTATKDGRTIAGAFNVKKGDRLYGRYWGAHEDLPFLHFNVCYYHGVAQAIREGLLVFEPGAGGEHKRARGFEPTMTHSAHWIRDARFRAILAAHVARETEAIEDFLGGQGPDPDG